MAGQDVISWISLRYSITQIVRSYGFNLELFYYEDLRTNPALFIYKVAGFLGLVVDTEIVNEVVDETSLEATRNLQEVNNARGERERTRRDDRRIAR